MRIVIDMQGAQSAGSRNRGIGRYTLAITKALARNRGDHRIVLALNGGFPDTVEPIRAAFEGLLPPEDIRVWQAAMPTAHADKANDWRRRAAELTYESFLASLKPDFVYVTSLFEGLADNSVTSIHSLLRNTPVAVTLYDLIPYIHPKPYLENPAVKAWYLEKVEHLKRADLWLAISESSRQEGIAHLGLPEEWSVNIATDADELFQPAPVAAEREAALRAQYGLSRPFVMYTGGIDYRKNVEGLIRAFARLPQPLRSAHQLAIVCSVQPASREELVRLVKQQGLDEQDVVLTGFVPDEDLLAFYNLCKLFVFPSWHEGFGLPALEAMRCGAPVIGANTSSLPEVIGWDEALFDPHSDESIARAIERGLVDDAHRQALLRHGSEQARRFSWDGSARQAIAAMERKRAQWTEVVSAQAPQRPKLAYVSPLQPVRSGIADYSAELLPELGRFYDIDVVVEQDEVTDPWVKANCPVRTPQWLREHAGQYDRVLYHFGNSAFHQHMFQLLQDVPGVVVLHDFFMSGVLAHMESRDPAAGVWLKSLYESHGHIALYDLQHAANRTEVLWEYPCSLGVVQKALGMIVHSRNSLRLAARWYSSDVSDWTVIPHMRDARLELDRAAARQALGIDEDVFLVCTFGLLAPTKLNHRLLQAWFQSSLAKDPSCRLVFVGENDGGAYGAALVDTIAQHQAGSQVHITGWADTDAFRRYLAAADVGVQLRTLSRGETSGTVLDCMNYAKPTIVNANGSMADLDPDVVWMLPDEFSDAQLVEALEKLFRDASLRQRMGEAARNTILNLHDPATCAAQYRDAIEGYYRHAEGHVAALARAIATQAGQADDEQLVQVSAAVARNAPPPCRPRQLLVDVGSAEGPGNEDLLAQIRPWLEQPPAGCRVEPVYPAEDGRYRYARRFTARLMGYEPILPDEAMDYWAGDVFMGPEVAAEQEGMHDDMRRQGVILRVFSSAAEGRQDLAGLLERNALPV
ncbi:glycosyltransferase [Bordetella sp. 2513F-2]